MMSTDLLLRPPPTAMQCSNSLVELFLDVECELRSSESPASVLMSLKTLATGLGNSWCTIVPRYINGEVGIDQMRHYAKGWGIMHRLAMLLATVSIDTIDTVLESSSDAKHAVFTIRRLVQLLSCGTRPTGNVYFILAPHSLSVKIGYTANPCPLRLLQLQTGTPEPLILLGYMPADERYTELFLHEHFRDQWIRGEWFKFNAQVVQFIQFNCDKRAPEETLKSIPEFEESKWNCDPWPKCLPQTNKEIEAWLSHPALY